MDRQMFCFQCEQTAGGSGCRGKCGVCGKSADVAGLRDELTSALIGLARAAQGDTHPTEDTYRLLIKGLLSTMTNVNINGETIRELIDAVHAEKERLVPRCSACASPCGRNDDYDVKRLWDAEEDLRSLRSLILLGIRGVAACAYHAGVLGLSGREVNEFLARALFAVGDDWDMEHLLPLALEVGKVNLSCMEMLDKANTGAFGDPVPVTVPLKVE
jgi:hydroxylamine reductase